MKFKFKLFDDQNEYFLSFYNKITFFILSNLLFYSISISAHGNLRYNSILFAGYLLLNTGMLVVINQVHKMKNWLMFITYSVTYVLFTVLGAFDFDIIFFLIINLFLLLTIKAFHWIIPHNNYENMLSLLGFIMTDDFNHDMAYQNYDIPIKRNDYPIRTLTEEIFALSKYNDMLLFKNKIAKHYFDEISNIFKESPDIANFTINKSVLLMTYKTILDFCHTGYSTVETKPISFKYLDKKNKDLLDDMKYTLEFKIDTKNLKTIKVQDRYKHFSVNKNHHKEYNDTNITIKQGIEEVKAVCDTNNFKIDFKHGVKNTGGNEYYIIRIIVSADRQRGNLSGGDSLMMPINQIDQDKIEKLQSIDISSSSGLTTFYPDTALNTEKTIDDIRFEK